MELENLTLEKILMESLALYLLKKSNVPTRELIADLLEIEAQAGRLVMGFLGSEEGQTPKKNPSGLLAQVLTCLPLNGAMNSRTPKGR
ncbi:MAG TPA: hypothetical protein PL182_10380 [Pseudobdellovibrionaceae bacterium]|nr:hypothetical protein [Pseudobdellovibrionaceae bacterium]